MSDKKYKKLRFVNPITNKSDVIRIDKSIVENATSFPVSITYFHEQHAISLFIDKNFAVRGAETSVFIDKKVEVRKNIDIESLNIVQSDETSIDAEFSDEKIIQSIESNLNDIEEKIGFLVIGSPRVGKTSLIYRYIYDFFNPSYVISNDVKNFKHDVEDVVGGGWDDPDVFPCEWFPDLVSVAFEPDAGLVTDFAYLVSVGVVHRFNPCRHRAL